VNGVNDMINLLACECGETPEIYPPTLGKHMEGSDPEKHPGRFFPVLKCKCGISMDGPNFDQYGTELAGIWNRRQTAIKSR